MSIRFRRTIDVQLPQLTPCAGSCGAGDQIVLQVLQDGDYRINSLDVRAAELESELSKVFTQRPEKIIYVAADSGVRYERVLGAMDVARASGVKVIAIAPASLSGQSHRDEP